MKNKLVCILLCAVMLVSAIMSTGCSLASGDATSTDTSGTDNTSATRTSMTLSLWVPTDESTTEEALYLVEAAINSVTQSEFDTAIKLYGIPESEYDAVMKDRLATIEQRIIEEEEEAKRKRQEQIEAAQRGETLVEETTEYVNPNMDGDYSLVVRGATGYTNLERNQLDIFLIHGMDDYKHYVDNLYIQNLNEEFSGSSKILKNYIYTDFIDAVRMTDGGVYAVPNNHAVGEFTYFLVNKDIVESEYLDPATLTSLEACKGLIEDVATYYPGVSPVYGEYSPSYYQYWNGTGDASKFSVLASRIYDTTPIEGVTFDNIFSYSNFTDNYYLYKTFKEKGYVNTSATVPEKFGVGYITCTAEEIEKYEEDYHITVFKKPMGSAADYTQGMFAVSSYSKSLARSMEIITLLNTSTELRTILQYGAEGTHWKYDEENEDIIVKLDTSKSEADITYKMNLFDTGNVYMTYPDFGVGLDQWESSKEQNLESYLPATYYFLSTKNEAKNGPVYYNDDNKALFNSLDALSASIYARMEAMTAEEFKAAVPSFKTEVDNADAFKKLTYVPSPSDQAQNRTPETGWIPEASMAYQWMQYCISVYGEETYNNLMNAG